MRHVLLAGAILLCVNYDAQASAIDFRPFAAAVIVDGISSAQAPATIEKVEALPDDKGVSFQFPRRRRIRGGRFFC